MNSKGRLNESRRLFEKEEKMGKEKESRIPGPLSMNNCVKTTFVRGNMAPYFQDGS